MSATDDRLRLVHALGAHVELRRGDVTLLRYVHCPDVPQLESPKPYFHPVRTLDGELVTAYRPHDHIWHKGIQFAYPHVGADNFWGGVTWVRDRGYEQLPNNGAMRHVAFDALEADGDEARIDERLAWITEPGEHILDERRRIGVRVLGGAWVLSLATTLSNRSGRELVFGSPTTNGRPDAGYGGILWRGPRSFTGGTVLASGGVRGEEDVMGATAPWAAFVGRHDETIRSSTIAFFDSDDNDIAPTAWFARSGPYATVGPAPFFDVEHTLAPGAELSLRYHIAIADGELDEEEIEALRPRALAGVASA
jgi:methane monooxygenase PmoA-like